MFTLITYVDNWCYKLSVTNGDVMVVIPGRKRSATHPELVWVQKERFMGWVCSGCAWEFNPSFVPAGNTLAEIKQKYERERDIAFESHVCAEHPKS
jgi:hypothetical protein